MIAFYRTLTLREVLPFRDIFTILLAIINFLSNRSFVPDCHFKLRRLPVTHNIFTRHCEVKRTYPKNAVKCCLVRVTIYFYKPQGCSVPHLHVWAAISSMHSPCSNWLTIQILGSVLGNYHWLLTHLTWRAAFCVSISISGTDPHFLNYLQDFNGRFIYF